MKLVRSDGLVVWDMDDIRQAHWESVLECQWNGWEEPTLEEYIQHLIINSGWRKIED
jgi:hypothetical protein